LKTSNQQVQSCAPKRTSGYLKNKQLPAGALSLLLMQSCVLKSSDSPGLIVSSQEKPRRPPGAAIPPVNRAHSPRSMRVGERSVYQTLRHSEWRSEECPTRVKVLGGMSLPPGPSVRCVITQCTGGEAAPEGSEGHPNLKGEGAPAPIRCRWEAAFIDKMLFILINRFYSLRLLPRI
jgi:hypothetical protein